MNDDESVHLLDKSSHIGLIGVVHRWNCNVSQHHLHRNLLVKEEVERCYYLFVPLINVQDHWLTMNLMRLMKRKMKMNLRETLDCKDD